MCEEQSESQSCEWEAAAAPTYDSSGVFGFHAVGRFLSGLFEAFLSLFDPKKDQEAHSNL